MKHYVYYLQHPDGALLYIGRSHDPGKRCKDFMTREGLMAELQRVEEFDSLTDAAAAETAAIKAHRPLYNKTSASVGALQGARLSEEHRRRMSEALKGKWGNRKGIPHTEECKAHLSAKLKGCPAPYVWTEEQRDRKRKELLGVKRGPYRKREPLAS